MAESNVYRDYQQGFTKLLWAMPVAHAAGFLAVFQLLGNVPDPDYAFRAIRPSVIALGMGGASGMIAILLAQVSLMNGMSANTSHRRAKQSNGDEATRFYRLANSFISRGACLEMAALVFNVASLAALLTAGALAFNAMDKGRLQPREPPMTPAEAVATITEVLGAISSATSPAKP